ncbi:MAG: hypothetical protein WDA20_10745 [Desulfuromonadales bacterium]
MKKPQWETGVKGASWPHRSKDSKMLLPDGKVETNMTVTARCKGEIVRLRILKELKPEVFKASIVGDYFLSEKEELNDGDEVTIDRKDILFLQGN